jgi:hypothetical protein
MRDLLKNYIKQKGAQVAEHLPNQLKALSSNPRRAMNKTKQPTKKQNLY